MQNFRTLGQPLLGEKYGAQKEREKERRDVMPLIVATYVCNAARAAHALRSDQCLVAYIAELDTNLHFTNFIILDCNSTQTIVKADEQSPQKRSPQILFNLTKPLQNV